MSDETEEDDLPESLQPYPLPRHVMWTLEDFAEIGYRALEDKIKALKKIGDELSHRERDREFIRYDRRSTVDPKAKPVGILDDIQIDAGPLRVMIGVYEKRLQEAKVAIQYSNKQRGLRCKIISEE